MSSLSTPEIDALVARLGSVGAAALLRRWIGNYDAGVFLRSNLAQPEPPAPGTEEEAGGGAGLAAAPSGGGAGLAATSSAPAEPRVEDCELHGPMQGGGLWYAPNSFGYSTFSPPCNGCRDGQRDAEAGLWMSGFGGTHNVFHGGAALCATATGGGLEASSSAPPPVDPRLREYSRRQTVMLDCLREAEEDPRWYVLDNLQNAIQRFREIDGAGDNLRHAEERLAALRSPT
jgi:hypothetical protein